MMYQFFVEFRFYGYPKRYLRRLTWQIARDFRVRGAIRKRPVPHMALYGNSTTSNIRHVFTAIEKVARQYTLVPFSVKGFDWREDDEGRKVVAANIIASPVLQKLRQELARELSIVSEPGRWDTHTDYWFHCTLAFKDIDAKFDRIWRFVDATKKPQLEQYLVRISVLNKNRRIVREYDLILNRWFRRWHVIPPTGSYWWRKTLIGLREAISLSPVKKRSLLQRFFDYMQGLTRGKTIHLIGDTHFDHANIIKYCHRPFLGVEEMNRVLVSNWNNLVRPIDTVYFLGDWSFGRKSRPPIYWIRRLNGQIISIKGSHDHHSEDIRLYNRLELDYQGYRFLLIHNPEEKPSAWDGWVIHGHIHNNNVATYPFINGETKTINVSVEVTAYMPVSIDFILSLDLKTIRRMDSVSSNPERWTE